MTTGTVVLMILILAIIAVAVYISMSQDPIPTRIRRLFKQTVSDRRDSKEPVGMPPRPNPSWAADPDRTNEAREIERVTGVIRTGEPFTIASGDPSHWNARGFDIEGLIIQVAEIEAPDVGGNFQFRYCVTESVDANVNTIVIEGDSPAAAVAYLGRAFMMDEEVGGVRVGSIVNQLIEERRRYRDTGAHEMPIMLSPYEEGTVIAARYEGRLALLEGEPGKGYLPLSASNPDGVRYSDMSVRLDPSGWIVRLVEVGAYTFLLELEPVPLRDLTVHHLA